MRAGLSLAQVPPPLQTRLLHLCSPEAGEKNGINRLERGGLHKESRELLQDMVQEAGLGQNAAAVFPDSSPGGRWSTWCPASSDLSPEITNSNTRAPPPPFLLFPQRLLSCGFL